jgi:hypothetical protein
MQEYSGRTSFLGKNATKGWEDATTNKTMGLQDQSLGLLRELPLYGVLEPSQPTRIERVSGILRSHRDRDENGRIAERLHGMGNSGFQRQDFTLPDWSRPSPGREFNLAVQHLHRDWPGSLVRGKACALAEGSEY